jgi:hypothetical protein
VPKIAEWIAASTIDAYLALRSKLFYLSGFTSFDGLIGEARTRLDDIDREIKSLTTARSLLQTEQPAVSAFREGYTEPHGFGNIPYLSQNNEDGLKRLEKSRTMAFAQVAELVRARDLINKANSEAMSSKIDVLDPPKAGKEPIGLSKVGRILTGFFAGGAIGAAFILLLPRLEKLRSRLR